MAASTAGGADAARKLTARRPEPTRRFAGSVIKPHRTDPDGFVRSLKFFRPSPVTIEDPTSGTILVETPLDPQQGLVAVARSGEGDVVVLGTSLWWLWIASEQESDSDNVKLLKNLLVKPSRSGK